MGRCGEARVIYVQDTADFLWKLDEAGDMEEREFMFPMDIVGLYPSVPRGKAKEAMMRNLEGRTSKKIPTEELLELSDLVLDNNEFIFEGKSHLQVEGTAIGSKLGRSYACTYMGCWEEEVKRRSMVEMKKATTLWFRFVDDIHGRWKGSKGKFVKFVEICNSVEEKIKVTYEVCEKEAVFLDVKVTRQEKRLKT